MLTTNPHTHNEWTNKRGHVTWVHGFGFAVVAGGDAPSTSSTKSRSPDREDADCKRHRY